jgi:hypothetical protein
MRKVLDRNKSNIKASAMSAPQFTLELLPGAERVLAEHRQELPQKNELCGAFWVTLGLRAFAGQDLEQDNVGRAASSLLSKVQTSESLPPGHEGRTDYVLTLPRVDDAEIDSGTSSEGLRVATAELSSGAFTAVPISGDWTAANLEALLESLREMDVECLAMANSATRFLWHSRASAHEVIDYLASGVDRASPSEWNVGHFIAIVGILSGPGGCLAVCADTYPTLGSNGVHLQPLGRVADSLRRDDSPYSGGILVMLPTQSVAELENVARLIGLTTDMWDNGTPYRPEFGIDI